MLPRQKNCRRAGRARWIARCLALALAAASAAATLAGEFQSPAAPTDLVASPEVVDLADALAPWTIDAAVEPVQLAMPRTGRTGVRRGATPTAARRSTATAARGAPILGLASIPYMIGDTGAGTCVGFDGIVDAELSHPTLACGRLNIAEANSALPVDRLYYSYRHFERASMISAYQFMQTIDYDRHLIGWERTFWDRSASVELRLPIERHITSQVFSTLVPAAGVVELLDATRPEETVELGNVAAIFKYLLWENDWAVISGGLGVTLPTARDVDYFLNVDGMVEFMGVPGLSADVQSVTVARFANETVYLEPYLAWLVAPSDRWYHQGFLQVEAAANPARVSFFGNGAAQFEQNGVPVGAFLYSADFPGRLELFSQSLMRLNLGLGRVVVNEPDARWLRQLTALFEVHYTTTLADANLTNVPITTTPAVTPAPLQTISIGNRANRVDILNFAVGASANMAGWIVTNGFVAPARAAPDRGFDFEYNLQVQRPF